jgi:hypothetical protein
VRVGWRGDGYQYSRCARERRRRVPTRSATTASWPPPRACGIESCRLARAPGRRRVSRRSSYPRLFVPFSTPSERACDVESPWGVAPTRLPLSSVREFRQPIQLDGFAPSLAIICPRACQCACSHSSRSAAATPRTGIGLNDVSRSCVRDEEHRR